MDCTLGSVCQGEHGHSGHLTAEMMLTDWGKVAADMPANPLHAGIALSGIYDLEPLLYCSENKGLRLDHDEVIAAGPMNRTPQRVAPMLIGYGAKEPDDMHRQSIQFAQKYASLSPRMESVRIEGADHFDMVNVLADAGSDLFKTSLDFIRC